jgi:large subunit ribosomal protein L9|tara:strand:+ start:614 stop:1057 length:444 start_codon:yes stop_codon:yes gene_type:complete
MKIILTTNIKKLGKVGDQVQVKNGFARNFLFPNKMALRDTKSNLQYFEKIKDEINIKENDKKQTAIDLIKAVKKIKIEFIKEADDKDQLYGSVSKKEIINYFNYKNIILFSDDIKIIQTIKTLGEHLIEISPYEGIIEQLKVTVKRI